MTTIPLLNETVYGVSSDNYNGLTSNFNSNAVQAADYYRLTNTSQTIIFNINDFEGNITIQGTLVKDPIDIEWVDLYELPNDSSAITINSSTTITGNYVWIRARVTNFAGGVINYVTVSY